MYLHTRTQSCEPQNSGEAEAEWEPAGHAQRTTAAAGARHTHTHAHAPILAHACDLLDTLDAQQLQLVRGSASTDMSLRARVCVCVCVSQERAAKLQEARALKVYEELRDCTFTPEVNKGKPATTKKVRYHHAHTHTYTLKSHCVACVKGKPATKVRHTVTATHCVCTGIEPWQQQQTSNRNSRARTSLVCALAVCLLCG